MDCSEFSLAVVMYECGVLKFNVEHIFFLTYPERISVPARTENIYLYAGKKFRHANYLGDMENRYVCLTHLGIKGSVIKSDPIQARLHLFADCEVLLSRFKQ
jgi:hypothetical protein